MIRVPAEDRESAVDLFAEDDAGELVGEGQGSEGEGLAGAATRFSGPAIAGADGEDQKLASLIALAPQPIGESLGGALASALIEEDNQRGGAGSLAFDGGPECLFGAKEGRFDPGMGGARLPCSGEERADAIDIHAGELVEGVTGAGADGSDPKLHGFSLRSAVGRRRVSAER
jgi:hypothetical protein